MDALVTVAMPVFNGGRFLQIAIESVLAQTFTRFELIISDNCSVDNSLDIARQYAAKDSRVRIHAQTKNIGLIDNFNFLIDLAKTPYFCFIASDDYWDKNFLAETVAAIEKRSGVGLVFGRYFFVDIDGNKTSFLREANYDRSRPDARIRKFMKQWDDACFYGLYVTSVMQGASFRPYFGKNSKYHLHIAFPLLVRILAKAEYCFCPTAIFYSRIHEEKHYVSQSSFPWRDYLVRLNALYFILCETRGVGFGRRIWLNLYIIILLGARFTKTLFTDVFAKIYAFSSYRSHR